MSKDINFDIDDFSIKEDLEKRVRELVDLGEEEDVIERVIVSELEDVGVEAMHFIDELDDLLSKMCR